MATLVWDQVGTRYYESGLDRGVLYLQDGTVVPWNGLTAITETFSGTVTPVYFDGMKVNDLFANGDYSAKLTAITYPDEFSKVEGLGFVRNGVWVADQKPQTFGLSYRTKIGNDTEGDEIGYKIHLLYNVTAVPSDRNYQTNSNNTSIIDFEWNLTAVPQEIPGFLPTAHYIFDSTKIEQSLMLELEKILYGAPGTNPILKPIDELQLFIATYFTLEVVDNKDGTWTATDRDGSLITMISETEYTIEADIVVLNATTYEISSELA